MLNCGIKRETPPLFRTTRTEGYKNYSQGQRIGKLNTLYLYKAFKVTNKGAIINGKILCNRKF